MKHSPPGRRPASAVEREHRRPAPAGRLGAPEPALRALQRAVGNRRVLDLLAGGLLHGCPPGDAAPAPRLVEDVVGSHGLPLASGTRRRLELLLGVDLGNVLVHRDERAARAAESVAARAFTVGDHVVLGAAVDPTTAAGQRVLAHEVVHVVQQRGAAAPASLRVAPGDSAAEAAASAAAQALLGGRPPGSIAPVATRAVQRDGPGDVKVAEAKTDADAREMVRRLAGGLLEVQLKADALQAMPSASTNVVDQQRMLAEHVERTTKLLRIASDGRLVDTSLFPGIEAAIHTGGLAADLMYLDRLGVAGGVSRVSRAGVNRGLSFAWGVMRQLAEDPHWSETNKTLADEWLRLAQFHRDTVADFISTAAVLKAGVTAAQIADLVVSGPELLATGKAALKDLARWLKEGGGGFGILRAAGPGGGPALVLVSGGRTLALTAAQVEALIQAGKLSANALILYSVAKGGGEAGALLPGGGIGEGPFGARQPGSKSRFTQEEIAKDIADETGKVPTGERALEEAGVTARQLRKVEENHHLLVQQLRKWFRERGVDIDEFTVKLTADEHRWIHNEYKWNDLWKDFRLKNPTASPADILAKMGEFQRQVGLEGLEIVPYPR